MVCSVCKADVVSTILKSCLTSGEVISFEKVLSWLTSKVWAVSKVGVGWILLKSKFVFISSVVLETVLKLFNSVFTPVVFIWEFLKASSLIVGNTLTGKIWLNLIWGRRVETDMGISGIFNSSFLDE